MDNVKLVIVVCRHGDRTPVKSYPNDPHSSKTYEPYGPGELTNIGKKRMFEVGKKLRKRYDKFLGDLYYPENLKIITTLVHRTKTTAQLVCAGLFPPPSEQKWEESLNWQPIPFSYNSQSLNMLISPQHLCDTAFRNMFDEVEKSSRGQEVYKKFDSILKFMEEKTGITPFRITNAFYLYMILDAQVGYGLVLPEWTKEVFPEPLSEIASHQYVFENDNLVMKQKTSGLFLSDIINDCDKRINNESKLKFVLYSGHECSVANFLIVLNLFDLKVPNYGSHVIFELTKRNNEHFVKIYYQNSMKDEEPKLLQIPGFEKSCPYNLLKTYLSKFIVDPNATFGDHYIN